MPGRIRCFKSCPIRRKCSNFLFLTMKSTLESLLGLRWFQQTVHRKIIQIKNQTFTFYRRFSWQCYSLVTRLKITSLFIRVHSGESPLEKKASKKNSPFINPMYFLLLINQYFDVLSNNVKQNFIILRYFSSPLVNRASVFEHFSEQVIFHFSEKLLKIVFWVKDDFHVV